MPSHNGFRTAAIRVVRPKKILELTHEGLMGGEIEVWADVSMDTYFELKRLIADEEGELLAGYFGDHILIDWNLVGEDDEALPPNGAGMNALGASMSLAIVVDWFDSLDKVSDPLEPNSSNGELSDLEQLDLGASSKSQAPSPGPAP